MQWDELRKHNLAKLFPVTGTNIAAFLPKFSADSSDQATPSQLWLKTVKMFSEAGGIVSVGLLLPAGCHVPRQRERTWQEAWSTGNLNVLLI